MSCLMSRLWFIKERNNQSEERELVVCMHGLVCGNEEIHPFTQNEKNDDGYI